MIKGVPYHFRAKPWQGKDKGAWHFVSLPLEMSAEIRINFQSEEEGWGRLKSTAKIGTSEWKTAIWYDSKAKTYLLLLKAEIRKREKLSNEKEEQVIIWI